MLKIFECGEMDKNEQCTLHTVHRIIQYAAPSISKHKRLTEMEDERSRES